MGTQMALHFSPECSDESEDWNQATDGAFRELIALLITMRPWLGAVPRPFRFRATSGTATRTETEAGEQLTAWFSDPPDRAVSMIVRRSSPTDAENRGWGIDTLLWWRRPDADGAFRWDDGDYARWAELLRTPGDKAPVTTAPDEVELRAWRVQLEGATGLAYLLWQHELGVTVVDSLLHVAIDVALRAGNTSLRSPDLACRIWRRGSSVVMTRHDEPGAEITLVVDPVDRPWVCRVSAMAGTWLRGNRVVTLADSEALRPARGA